MTKTTYPLEGGCACGAVRYRLETEPLFVNCCHCSWCQRETGSAFVVNAMIEADRVTLLSGAPVSVLTPSQSGRGQRIWRCDTCRVALWSNYAGAGNQIHFVRVGTLDQSNALPPRAHVFTARKLDWVVIPEDQPGYSEFYDPMQVWPEETRNRIRNLDARTAEGRSP